MTIHDIAKEAGVSASSVSRVINGKPGVNAKARARVMALLSKYDYVSPREAHRPFEGTGKLVGILVADVRIVHLTEGAYHISQSLSEYGYNSIIQNTGNSDEKRAAAIRNLKKRNVSAIVLMGSQFESEVIGQVIAQEVPDIPVFMLNGFLNLPNVCGVLSDEKSGVKDCIALLASEHRSKIAMLIDQPRPSSSLKEEGFIEGMLQLGYRQSDLWIYRDISASLQGGYAATEQLLTEHPDLDGLICSLDIIACGAIHALVQHKIEIPGQVAVIGIDNSLYAEICLPQLTSLDNMILDSGVTLAHKLIDCLEGRKTNQRTVLLPAIVERASTGSRR